jgi:hypothetical protein
MVREVEAQDVDEGYTMEAQWEQPCPDECGFVIEPGDLITPVDEGDGTIWVLAEHPA